MEKRVMKAKLVKTGCEISIKGNNANNGYDGTFLVIDHNWNRIIDCRIYWRGQSCHCHMWVSGNDGYCSGSGSAGGYGYDKESSAVQDAITACGYKLFWKGKSKDYCSISGVGRTAIDQALMAIGKSITSKQLKVIKTYG